MRTHSLLILPLSLLSFSSSILADKQVNQTIDDTKGDSISSNQPVYSGPAWNALSQANIASTNIPLDTSQVFDGTWHNAVAGRGSPSLEINVQFTGVAVYAFFILPNSGGAGFAGFYQNVTFILDGKVQGSFFNNGSFEPGPYVYNASLFSMQGLSNSTHNLTIIGPPYQGPFTDVAYQNLLLFDYVAYTQSFPDEKVATTTSQTSNNGGVATQASQTSQPASSSSSSNAGAIAGGVVGGLAILAALVIAGLWLLRRQRNNSNTNVVQGYTGGDYEQQRQQQYTMTSSNTGGGGPTAATMTQYSQLSASNSQSNPFGSSTQNQVSPSSGEYNPYGPSPVNGMITGGSAVALGATAGAMATTGTTTNQAGPRPVKARPYPTPVSAVSGATTNSVSASGPSVGSTNSVYASGGSGGGPASPPPPNQRPLPPVGGGGGGAETALLHKLRRELEEKEAQAAVRNGGNVVISPVSMPRSVGSTGSTHGGGGGGADAANFELFSVIERLRAQVESLEGRLQEREEREELPPRYVS